ncbi:MAG: alpha-L-rhamnosidase [Clostridia bacterium]|nr:alpha-L-rhamnosidase [Clostridia bacterium]
MKSHTKTEIIFPKRIVLSEGRFDNLDALLKEKPLQIGLGEREFTSIHGKGFVVLDFGKEICGTARIFTYTIGGETKVRLRFGESVGETMAELGYKGACNDHSNRDAVVSLQNFSDMRFMQTGFRFLRIDFLQESTLNIKSIVAEGEIYSNETIYDYKGGDGRIKDIFNVAKRTVDLCASSGFIWDGVKRDRLVWIGDMYPETMAYATLYGRCDIVERSLDFIVELTPLPGWMNGMPAYSMWWIIILTDYAMKVGAYDYLEKQMPYMKELVELMNAHVGGNGEFNYPGLFVDWPTHDQPDEPCGVRAINIIAAKRAIANFKRFGIDTTTAEELLAKLEKQDMPVVSAKQVLALKYFASGSLSRKEADMLIEGGAKGFSTFMSYFILTAIAKLHGTDTAIKLMKEFYGAMLDRGATTFFEDFNMDWLEGSGRIDEPTPDGMLDIHGDFGAFCYIGYRHSLCHGWSAGVIPFIAENLG